MSAASPRRRRRPPSYRHHKGTGQAVVTLNGKDFYLGVYGTPQSRQKYDRVIAEWFANGRQIMPKGGSNGSLMVNDVVAAFWLHAESYYVGPDGQPTGELDNYRVALRPLLKLYGTTPAAEFGPLALKAVREEMVRSGWARTNINRQVNRIRYVFKWATSQEFVPGSVWEGLRSLVGLRQGRSEARETEPVRPAPKLLIEAVKPFVSSQVWDLIQLQLLTGARAGELVKMRPVDIDTSADVWTYTPENHKTAHHGHKRTIYLGPRAQAVVGPYLAGRPTNAYLFSPAEAEGKRRERQHADRKTPLSCGNVPGSNRRTKPARQPGDYYSVASYRRAIARACELAFPPPETLRPRVLANGRQESRQAYRKRLTKEEKAQLNRWRREHSWHPHRLRHSAATSIRKEYGLESSKLILGHKSMDTTQIYAEADQEKAREVIRRVG